MERSFGQIRWDIDNRKDNFKRCKDSAPSGYEFLCNYNLKNEKSTIDIRTLKWYKDNGYIVLSEAYNMYGEVVSGSVGIYRQIK